MSSPQTQNPETREEAQAPPLPDHQAGAAELTDTTTPHGKIPWRALHLLDQARPVKRYIGVAEESLWGQEAAADQGMPPAETQEALETIGILGVVEMHHLVKAHHKLHRQPHRLHTRTL